MRNAMMALSLTGCISAASISQRLSALDSDTDNAVSVRDSASCDGDKRNQEPCKDAVNCLDLAALAASLCKESNDSAAISENLITQSVKANKCRVALNGADNACKQYRKSQ